MGLESATYIQSLDSSNPIGASDPKSEGDDHLRLLKSVLKSTFPNSSKVFYFPTYLTKTAAYTITSANDQVLLGVSAASAAYQITLPTTLGSGAAGFSLTIIKTDNTAFAVTVAPSSGTINGAASYVLSLQYQMLTVFWNGTAWFALEQALASAAYTWTGNHIFQGTVAISGVTTLTGATTLNTGAVLICNDTVTLNAAVAVNAAMTLTKPLIQTPVALTYGASIAVDLSLGNVYTLTLTGSPTLSNPTGEVAGQSGFLIVTQDSTGGRTVTFSAQWLDPGNTPEQPDPASNAVTCYLFHVTATNSVVLRKLWSSGRKRVGGYATIDLGALNDDSTQTAAHSLGALPSQVDFFLKCTTTDEGYAVGDYIPLGTEGSSTSSRGLVCWFNATNVGYTMATLVRIISRSTFTNVPVTASSWSVIANVFE